jgi:hypothetical protein
MLLVNDADVPVKHSEAVNNRKLLQLYLPFKNKIQYYQLKLNFILDQLIPRI